MIRTGASLCNDSLFYFSRMACWDQDGLAQIKRRIVAAAKWLQRFQASIRLCWRAELHPACRERWAPLALNVRDASWVIAFGTSAPCHFSATNVTELWPNPDILYSAPSLIWLQWYHIWADLIRGLQGFSLCPCSCLHLQRVRTHMHTSMHRGAPCSQHACVSVATSCGPPGGTAKLASLTFMQRVQSQP